MNEFDASEIQQRSPPFPMSFSQVLDRIWRILRGRFLLLVRLGIIPAGALFAMYALMFGGMFAFGVLPAHPGTPPDSQRLAWILFPTILISFAPMMIAYGLFEGAASQVALAANRGEESSFFEAYGAAWRNLGRIVWLLILRWLWIALPMMVVFALLGGAAAVNVLVSGRNTNPGVLFLAWPLLVLAYFGGMVYAVWMTLRLGLALPACVNEDLTAMESLKRSRRLAHGALGRIFLIILVVYAINAGIMIVIEMAGLMVAAVIGLIASLMHMHLTQPLTGIGIGLLAIVVISAFLLFMTLSWASYAVAFSVLYDDQRLRVEGMMGVPGGKSA